jgi:hypothetical protein
MSKHSDTHESWRSHISPAHFFSTDQDKTKLNWFLFEFARELESFVHRKRRLRSRLSRKKVDDNALAGFCVHYAKSMKGQILARVSGQTDNVRIGYEEIETYFTKIGDYLVDQLLTVAAEAWESQTAACACCPTRCISERDERASMFDDPDSWD